MVSSINHGLATQGPHANNKESDVQVETGATLTLVQWCNAERMSYGSKKLARQYVERAYITTYSEHTEYIANRHNYMNNNEN